MNSDLISRSGLGIDYANPDVFNLTEYAKGWNNAVKIIKEAPAVDAVEVVRCGECRFNADNMEADPLCLNDYAGADIVCTYWESDGLAVDDFCSRGKRRSDGT